MRSRTCSVCTCCAMTSTSSCAAVAFSSTCTRGGRGSPVNVRGRADAQGTVPRTPSTSSTFTTSSTRHTQATERPFVPTWQLRPIQHTTHPHTHSPTQPHTDGPAHPATQPPIHTHSLTAPHKRTGPSRPPSPVPGRRTRSTCFWLVMVSTASCSCSASATRSTSCSASAACRLLSRCAAVLRLRSCSCSLDCGSEEKGWQGREGGCSCQYGKTETISNKHLEAPTTTRG